MKRAQASFEYIILFSFIFVIFIVLATFILVGINKVSTTEEVAQDLANRIKVKVITASLAGAEYESEITIPPTINGERISNNTKRARSRLQNISTCRKR